MASYSQLLERRYKDRLDADAADLIERIRVDDDAGMRLRIIEAAEDALAHVRDGVVREGGTDEVIETDAVACEMREGIVVDV